MQILPRTVSKTAAVRVIYTKLTIESVFANLQIPHPLLKIALLHLLPDRDGDPLLGENPHTKTARYNGKSRISNALAKAWSRVRDFSLVLALEICFSKVFSDMPMRQQISEGRNPRASQLRQSISRGVNCTKRFGFPSRTARSSSREA
jgi:hypothetical protein